MGVACPEGQSRQVTRAAAGLPGAEPGALTEHTSVSGGGWLVGSGRTESANHLVVPWVKDGKVHGGQGGASSVALLRG